MRPALEVATGTGTVERCPDRQNDPELRWDQDWQAALADAALARVKRRVPPRQFQMFDLYVVKQWPLRRISRTLGVSMGQVYLVKARVSFLLQHETRRVRTHMERPPKPDVPKQNQPTPTV